MTALRTIALATLTAALLSGCGKPPPDPHAALRQSIDEGTAVRICANGAIVGVDRDRRHFFIHQGPASFASNGLLTGYLAAGVSPEDFCATRQGRPQ